MKTTDLTLTRTISATPDQVYDVWLDAKSPGGPWFGNERVILDARVDGLFHHAVKHEGRIWAHYGRFITLDRGARIEHTWMSEATKGLDTTVRITLTERDGKTELVLQHLGVPDDDMGRQHEQGWTWMLSMIEKRFSAPS